MRYVDLTRLRRPQGWDERACRALQELRLEVHRAEALAQANEEDTAVARRQAIRNGLTKPGREEIWRSLSGHLAALSEDKCWYSESRNPASDKNVDHFRPKGAVYEDCTHEGYWWLAFDWRNFRYSSQWCNQLRKGVNGTRGGKGNRFPLLPGSPRAEKEGDSHEDEQPMLLDPTDPEDWRLLTFRLDGHATPTCQSGSDEHCRAMVSIEAYHLQSKELVDQRRLMAVNVQRVVVELYALFLDLHEDGGVDQMDDKHKRTRTRYKGKLIELFGMIAWDAEYSAAAICCARGLVYSLQDDQQVKKEWLVDILNNRP